MRTSAVSTTIVAQMTNFQKFSHWETEREKTGSELTGEEDGTAGEGASGGERPRNSPPGLHFLATARMTSPQKGQRLVASGSAETGVAGVGSGCGVAGAG